MCSTSLLCDQSILSTFLIIPVWYCSFSIINPSKPRLRQGSRCNSFNLITILIILLTSMLTKAAPSGHICNQSQRTTTAISQHSENSLVINTFRDRQMQLILAKEVKDSPIHSSSSTFDGKESIQVSETRSGFSLPSKPASKKPSELSRRSRPRLVKRMPIDLVADEGGGSKLPQKLFRLPKILAGLDCDSLPVVKMKSRLEDYFRPSSWLKHVQRVLRQITSKAIANGVVGSNWDCFTFQSANTTDLDPSHIKSAFWGMMMSDGDESGGIFRQIIMWAPIGTVLKRAEVDLHSNFPEILVAYVNTDSSAGIAKHTSNSFDTKRKDDNGSVDQYLSYQFTIHRSTDRASREELKADLVTESPEDEPKNVFSRAFGFWLSAVLHSRLSATTQIITIEPWISTESKSSFSACSINLSNGLEGDIKSIYLYTLPIYDPLISTRWKEEDKP